MYKKRKAFSRKIFTYDYGQIPYISMVFSPIFIGNVHACKGFVSCHISMTIHFKKSKIGTPQDLFSSIRKINGKAQIFLRISMVLTAAKSPENVENTGISRYNKTI